VLKHIGEEIFIGRFLQHYFTALRHFSLTGLGMEEKPPIAANQWVYCSMFISRWRQFDTRRRQKYSSYQIFSKELLIPWLSPNILDNTLQVI
jgi:hypothetical protein